MRSGWAKSEGGRLWHYFRIDPLHRDCCGHSWAICAWDRISHLGPTQRVPGKPVCKWCKAAKEE